MSREYVEKREDAYWIVGTRISLDSLAYAFRRGASPEAIQRSFPSLSLEQVFGALAFYLAHQAEVDSSLLEDEAEFELLTRTSRANNQELRAKLDEARKHVSSSRRK
ncbi:MAG: DUF433 domain-containing protein [Vicinamibacteria bacterium]